ncbi:hypothetical protein BE20_05775 [Sorangium cellulosum]|nr:hypothetical protein BE20_05775 [Sorangium cellulosum]
MPSAFHTRTVSDAEATRRPSGLNAVDAIRVAAEDEGLAGVVDVPHPRGPVVRRGDEVMAIRAERHGIDLIVVTAEDERIPRAVGVPHPRRPSCDAVAMRLPSGLNATP